MFSSSLYSRMSQIKVEKAVCTVPASAAAVRGHRSAGRCAHASNHEIARGKRCRNVLAIEINASYNLSTLRLAVKDSSLKSSLQGKSPSLSPTKGTRAL